jgi:hypothetical protein
MTTDLSAVRLAIDLLQAPSRVRIARARPLPGGVPFLLRVAARDADAEIEAARVSGRSVDFVREAAIFFVEQVLFGAESDSYRVLGSNRDASAAELRRNMALLLRSFHPDIERDQDRSMAVAKVTRAWDDLKSPDRRALYDRALAELESKGGRDRGKHIAKHGGRGPIPVARRLRSRRQAPGRRIVERGDFVRMILLLFGWSKREGRPRP